jgi:hypothetical protein
MSNYIICLIYFGCLFLIFNNIIDLIYVIPCNDILHQIVFYNLLLSIYLLQIYHIYLVNKPLFYKIIIIKVICLLIYVQSNNLYCDGLLNKALKGILTPDKPTPIEIHIDPFTKGVVCTAGVCLIGLCGFQAYKVATEPKSISKEEIIKHIDNKFSELKGTLISLNNSEKEFISNENTNLQTLITNNFTVQTQGQVALLNEVACNIIENSNNNAEKVVNESTKVLSHLLDTQQRFENTMVNVVNTQMEKIEKEIENLKKVDPIDSDLDKNLLQNVIEKLQEAVRDTSTLSNIPQENLNSSISAIRSIDSINSIKPNILESQQISHKYVTPHMAIQKLFEESQQNARFKSNKNLEQSKIINTDEIKNNSDQLRNKTYELVNFDDKNIIFQSTSHSSIPGLLNTVSRTGKFLINNMPSKETLVLILGMCELAYCSPVTIVLSKLGLSLDKINDLFGYKKSNSIPYQAGKTVNETLLEFFRGITGKK